MAASRVAKELPERSGPFATWVVKNWPAWAQPPYSVSTVAGPGPIAVGSATGVSSFKAWRFDWGFGRSGVMGAEAAAGSLSPWLHLCAGKPPRP